MTEAFVTAIGFPRTVRDLLFQVTKNANVEDEADVRFFDIDLVLDPPTRGLNWSVPIWAQPGDLCVFYIVGRMRAYINDVRKDLETNGIPKNLLNELSWDGDPTDLVQSYLSLASEISADLSGKFIALGRVADFPAPASPGSHFRERSFAPIDDPIRLHIPVPYSLVNDTVHLRRAATITRLSKAAWEAILAKSECASLPTWASAAQIGSDAIPDELRANWRAYVQGSSYRCKTESELREFVIDPFLLEIADPRTPILSECRCMGGTGIVDNAFQLNGRWHLAEIKQRIDLKYLRRQILQYLSARKICPMLGQHKGQDFALEKLEHCFAFDSVGAYKIHRSNRKAPDETALLSTWQNLAGRSTATIRLLLSGR